MLKDKKTVALTLYFWTNDLFNDDSLGPICWDSGVLAIQANRKMKIKGQQVTIQCFEDIIPAIKELFRKNKVFVISSNRRPRILSHARRKDNE